MIQFFSRFDMIKMLKKGLIDFNEDVVISVNDTPREYDEMYKLLIEADPTCLNFITLMFNDDDEDFSDVQAKIILNFIKTNGHKKNYMVNCFAGISRSGAIAKFINEYHGTNDWYLEGYKGYNKHVFNMLNKAAGTSLAAYYEELEKADRRV